MIHEITFSNDTKKDTKKRNNTSLSQIWIPKQFFQRYYHHISAQIVWRGSKKEHHRFLSPRHHLEVTF